MVVYSFIDGAYLRDKFRECMLRYHDEEASPDVPAGSSAIRGNATKVFYYDCIDERQRENESNDEFRRRLTGQEAQFAAIREIPGWHVREGRLVGARKQSRQKRVDILLAVEMLSHAFNKNMDKAILIAGDDDFTPLVEELLRHGTYTEVWSDRWVASQHLVHASDYGRRLGYPFYWQMASKQFQEEHPRPEDSATGMPPGGHLLKFGIAAEQQPSKIFDVGGTFHFCTVNPGGTTSLVRSREIRSLEAYLQYDFAYRQYVPEKWQDSTPRVPL